MIHCVVCDDFFLPALILFFSVLTKRLVGKSISDITYLVSSGTLKLYSVISVFNTEQNNVNELL